VSSRFTPACGSNRFDEIRYFPTVPDGRYHVQPFWTNDTLPDEIAAMNEIARPENHLTSMMSRRYLEKESIYAKGQNRKKPELNRVNQKSIRAESITERKLDNRRSGEKENAPQRWIYNTD
jgi:hypothetical protein